MRKATRWRWLPRALAVSGRTRWYPALHMASEFSWLTPHGEIAAQLRAMDWSASPLGLPDAAQSLRSAINACLRSRFPMYVWWGPQSINIYNDAYTAIAGPLRHPQLFGRPAREMWPEIWETMGGFLDDVRRTGKPVYHEDLLFKLERNGGIEDAYFTFSFTGAG